MKTLIWAFWLAQITVFVFGKLVTATTLIWALWLAQKGVFAFGKLVSAKLVLDVSALSTYMYNKSHTIHAMILLHISIFDYIFISIAYYYTYA